MPSRHPVRSILSLAALSALASAALAQSAPTAPATDAPVQTIEITASSDASAGGLKAPYAGRQVARGGRVGILGSQDLMDTPFTATNYTQDLIQNQQAASVGDVLLNDPAVRVTRGFGNFQQVYMVRGLPVYSDDMAYNGLYGLLPRQYLAAEVVERVEVLRGASAFLNGAAPGGSGLGGAVNVMPKRAPNAPLTQVTVGVESGGEGYFAADIARRFGADQASGLRFNAVRRDGDTEVKGEKRELSVISLGGDWRSRDVRLSGDIGYQNHRMNASVPSVTFSGTVLDAPKADTDLAQPWTHSYERDTFGTLRGEVDLAPNVTAWAAGGMRKSKEDGVFTSNLVTADDGTMSSYRFDNARKDNVRTGELGIRASLVTAGIKHALVASAAMYRLSSKNAYAFSDFAGYLTNLYDPVHVDAPSTAFFTGGDMDAPLVTAKTKTSSFAIADTLSFAGDSVLLTLGARHQKIEDYGYDYNTGAQLSEYSKSKVTPVAGLVLKASKEVSVYANYIEGLTKGDTASGNGESGNPVSNVGEVFKPYSTKQTELGVKADWGRFGGSLGVFQSRKPISGVVGEEFVGDADKQRNRGVELAVYGEPTRGLRLLGGLSLLDTEIKSSGNDAIGAPKTQLNLGTEWEVPGISGLWLTGRVIYTGKQYANSANTQEVPSWTRLDLGARYAFEVAEREVTLRARVDNATGKDYWASAGGYPGAGYLTLGAPRTFVLTATVDF